MKRIQTLFILLLAGMFLGSVQAQTLKEVLDGYFEANNQKKSLEIKSMVMNAKVVQMGMEIPMVMKIKKPDKVRMEMNIQGQQMVTAFDGKDGWMIAPWMGTGVQDLPTDQLKDMKERADFEGDLWNYEAKGHTAEFLGKQDMEGTPTYVIKLNKKNGDVVTYYIDADSYILLKQVTQTTINGSPMETEQLYSNYKMVNGIPVPMNIETRAMGQSAQIVFDSVQYDVELDDSIFSRPTQ